MSRCPSAALVVGAALLVLAGGAMPTHAQASQRGEVRGTVRSTLGERVSYAVVALEPGASRRFTDDSGAFALPGLAPGTYQLRARQVGYRPFDTTLVVPQDSTVTVTIGLEHLVVELQAIRVIARAISSDRCTAPGPPDPKLDPDFAAVFDQLRENAERYWLLADSYPAIYRLERRFGRPESYGRGVEWRRLDTLSLWTDARWHYAPGRVVTEERAPHGTETQVNLPGLPDFADSAFLANHCFAFAGIEKVDGRPYARLDFRAADAIQAPDVNGSALLDPESYLIRFLRVHLTEPGRVSPFLESLEGTVAFREVMPLLVLPDRISKLERDYDGGQIVRNFEEQRMVGFTFVRSPPTEHP